MKGDGKVNAAMKVYERVQRIDAKVKAAEERIEPLRRTLRSLELEWTTRLRRLTGGEHSRLQKRLAAAREAARGGGVDKG